VRYHGPYAPERVDALMQTVDVVVVPSIWWENAPTVMQEAARNGRAVVCSDIGGMAEMAAEIGAAVFPVGSAGDLAVLLSEPDRAQTKSPPRSETDRGFSTSHCQLYRSDRLNDLA
jgi:glycosyltransferase involved in cell wall biosynthesis